MKGWWEQMKKSTRKSTKKSEGEVNIATEAASNPAVLVESVTQDEPTPGHRAPTLTEVQGLIAQCAYERYAQRGFQDGYHEDDWLQAEKQVLAQAS